MKTLTYQTEIQANKDKIWEVLWGKENYTKWTKPFTEGCYYETDSFSPGNEIRFLAPNGDGMISKIVELQPQEYVAFAHIAMLENGKIITLSEDKESKPFIESYRLIENGTTITLKAQVDTLQPWEESMNSSFPKALQLVKELSE